MLVLLIFIWGISGICSFVYWLTSEFDLRINQLIMVMPFILVAGPISFIVGFCVHSEKVANINVKRSKIIISKRN